MSLIFATQLTAVVTVALAVLALATAILALLAWRKQSREVSDQAKMLRVQSEQLGLQAEELRQVSAEREREALERRRTQAVLVYMWETWDDDGATVYHVRNTSRQPVYRLAFEWRTEFPGGERVRQPLIEPLMPGEERTTSSSDSPDWSGVTAIFRDSAGVWWRIRPGEVPAETPTPPAVALRGPDADGAPAGNSP